MMTKKDAMMMYINKMVEEWERDDVSLDTVFECEYCPFREACHNSTDDNNCGEFIKTQLLDA